MKAQLFRFLSFLAKSNLLISTAASGAVLSSYLFFGTEPNDNLILFTFFATLFTYNFQRLVGDWRSSGKAKNWNTIWMILSGPFLIYLLPYLPLHIIPILGACGILSLAYVIPIIPTASGRLSLRLVPRLKFWVIMAVWSFSVILLPFIGMQAPRDSLLFYFLMQFFFIGSLTIVFDIQDLKVDRPSQRTIPQVLGVAGARRLAIVMLLLSALAAIAMSFFGFVEQQLIWAQLLIVFFSIAVVSRAHPDNHPLYFSVLVDGLIILQTMAFFLVKYLT